MDRIEQLERNWLIYKSKRLIKTFMALSIVVFFGVGIAYLYNYQYANNDIVAVNQPPITTPKTQTEVQSAPREQVAPNETIAKQEQVAPQETIAANETIAPQETIVTATVAETTAKAPIKPKLAMKLRPNLAFESTLEQRIKAAAARVRESKPVVVATATQTAATTNNAPTQPPKTATTIRRVDSLEQLEEAYNKQPTYAKAVEIAEGYLSKGDAQRAYSWALKANELNDVDDRSWAVFASASYRMGYKERALNALQLYLSSRTSEKLSRLLREIETDKPKESL
ncbi:MAG: hypothetical protein LBN32_02970 [Helicobacteraceae bacterium]|jgi:hypothetical protein|nr:hypothetical protein [Helicobacteraceae bacterium]